MQGISTCDLDVGIPTHARDREKRSSQQFCINNIGHHLAIRVENRNVVHMCIINTTKKKTLTLCGCNLEAKKKTLTKWVYLFLYKESEPLCVFKDFFFLFCDSRFNSKSN
jgi:hypothetical protein